MKHGWLLGLLLIPFQGALLAQAPQPSRPVLTVSLPLNINPETVTLQASVDGRLSLMSTKRGIYDYPVELHASVLGSARSLKLLIYIPGYQMVAQEFTGADIQTGKVFIPPLVPLPTAVLHGRLVNSGEKPLSGQTLYVKYLLSEAMNYFGYTDGMVDSLHIASVKTDSKGEFTINVPSLVDDPFFQSNGHAPREFQLDSEDNSPYVGDRTLTPHSFPAQKAYTPLLIRNAQKGTLSGKLGKEFLRQNNLSEDLRVYIRQGDTVVTGIELRASGNGMFFNANLKVDGSYEIQLPPAEYELTLWVSEIQELIPIKDGLVVEENKQRIFNLP